MKHLHAFWWLALLTLAGCASAPKPETTLEALYVSAEYAQGLVLSANQAHESGVISAEDYAKFLDAAQEVHDTLLMAKQAYQAGNMGEAATHLDRVEFALRTAALILSRFEQ